MSKTTMNSLSFLKSYPLVIAIAVALLVTACSGSGGQEIEHGGQDVAEASELRITQLVVRDGDDPMATLTPEGRVIGGDPSEGNIVGTLSPEGRLVDPQGTLIGTLHPDGRWVPGDSTTPATIGENGSITAEGFEAPLSIRENGAVFQGDEPIGELRVDGLNENNRRTAGLLVYLTVESVRELFAALARAVRASEDYSRVDEGLREGQVDCNRIEDAAYRQQMLDAGIDPASIDCHEDEGAD